MASLGCLLLGLLAGAAQAEIASYSLPSPWSYECDTSNSSYKTTSHLIPAKCVKVPSSSSEKVQGLQACKMTCGSKGTLWPAPQDWCSYLQTWLTSSLRISGWFLFLLQVRMFPT